MRYSHIYPSLLLSLTAATLVFTSPVEYIGEYAEGTTPFPPLGEGPGLKLCKKSPIRYNPTQFVCHDNEVICPILDQGSQNPHPMQRCGESCFDDRIVSCENNKVISGPPKRSWELGVDLAFAHHIQHAPPSSSEQTYTPTEHAADEALLKRYASAFGHIEGQNTALYKRYEESVLSTTPAAAAAAAAEAQRAFAEQEQKREDDEYLHLEKRWRRENMVEPVVRVKQNWETTQNTEQEQNQGRIQNGKSRAVEWLGKVEGWEEEELIAEEEEEEGEEDDYLLKRDLEEQEQMEITFEKQMKELEKVLAAVV